MTAQEMRFRFEDLYSKAFGGIVPKAAFLDSIEIAYFLNLAQDKFVEEWYRVFEYNEAARKRLSALVVETSVDRTAGAPTSSVKQYGEIWALPANTLYVVQEQAHIVRYAVGPPEVETIINANCDIKPVNLDYYNKHVNNSFKKPYSSLIWRLDIGDKKHEFITYDSETAGAVVRVKFYKVTYIKSPAEIKILTSGSVNCELSSDYHMEIVDEAVNIALSRFSLSQEENK